MMFGLQRGWLLVLVAALSAIVLLAVACSDDDDGLSVEEAQAVLCGDLDTLGDTLEALAAINAQSTVGELRDARDAVGSAAEDVKSSAEDVDDAKVGDIETASSDLESAVDDISDDATIADALTSVAPAVSAAGAAWDQAFTAAECLQPDATEEPAATEGPAATSTTEAADGNGEGAETSIAVALSEFVVEPSESSAPAGTVTFSVTNDGAIPHSFQVIASDLAADALPVDEEAFVVDEDAVDVVASSVDDVGIDAGESEDVSADLDAGSYVLICNVPTHYEAGMSVAFTVE